MLSVYPYKSFSETICLVLFSMLCDILRHQSRKLFKLNFVLNIVFSELKVASFTFELAYLMTVVRLSLLHFIEI
jgi:hypothetical protein